MLHRPAVLFLDEPTVGLDPVARRAVWTHIRDDVIAIMHHGHVTAVDTPSALKAVVGPGATLEASVHFTGSSLEQGGAYRDAVRARRVARRLG